MTHDWFKHDHLATGKKEFEEFHNRVTHSWDASHIYGSSEEEEEEDRVRLDNGSIYLDENDELDYDENGCASN